MKKISTLYKKDPNDLSRVIDEVDPQNEWVFKKGIPTRQWDGTACMIKDGKLYKRYDVERSENTGQFKTPPEGSIECSPPDEITGQWLHWVPVTNQDTWHKEAFDNLTRLLITLTGKSISKGNNGTYELCGEEVQGNPENLKGHILIRHGVEILPPIEYTYDNLKEYFQDVNIEGLVFHEKGGDRMCKIRLSDFGIKRRN